MSPDDDPDALHTWRLPVSALLHPHEFTDFLPIVICYLLIPAMYLILTMYALCNMHDITWGTREVVQTKAAKEREQERQLE